MLCIYVFTTKRSIHPVSQSRTKEIWHECSSLRMYFSLVQVTDLYIIFTSITRIVTCQNCRYVRRFKELLKIWSISTWMISFVLAFRLTTMFFPLTSQYYKFLPRCLPPRLSFTPGCRFPSQLYCWVNTCITCSTIRVALEPKIWRALISIPAPSYLSKTWGGHFYYIVL